MRSRTGRSGPLTLDRLLCWTVPRNGTLSSCHLQWLTSGRGGGWEGGIRVTLGLPEERNQGGPVVRIVKLAVFARDRRDRFPNNIGLPEVWESCSKMWAALDLIFSPAL